MKRLWKVSILLAALGLTACGHDKDSKSSNATYQTNGVPSGDYFRQFLYQETGQCGTPHERHHYVKSETIKIGMNPAGKDVLATLALFLQSDGTYWAYYQEIVVRQYFRDGYNWDSHQERIVQGRWSIAGAGMFLSGLGRAIAHQYNGAPGMDLQMETELISPGLRGKAVFMRRGAGEDNPVPEINPCMRK